MRKRDSINSIISDMSFDEYELDVDRRNIELFEENIIGLLVKRTF